VISSSSNDWLIFSYLNEENNHRNINFLPIIGWKYHHNTNSSRCYEPVTPFYGKEGIINRFSKTKKYFRYYWIRDGKEFDFTDDVNSSGRSFWEDLNGYVLDDTKIDLLSNVPDSLRTKYYEIIEKKYPTEYEYD
jgi:hypothetical protein